MASEARSVPLFQLYFHELLWLVTAICKNCELIFRNTDPPTDGHFINVDPELHARIATVLINAANFKKLLVAPTVRPKAQPLELFEFRKRRAKILATALAGIDMNEMFNVKVRNSIEHFDEYLDEANLELAAAKTPPSPLAAYNMTFSSWELMSPRPYPVRLYIADKRMFHNLKYSVDLGKLYNEALTVRGRLLETPALSGVKEPGGLMVPLGPKPNEPDAQDAIVLRRKRR